MVVTMMMVTMVVMVMVMSDDDHILFSMLHIRGRLAPAKAEKLIVLKENLDLVEHFKENSLYKLQKSGGHNAFDVVEMEAFAVEGPLEDEEELELYLEA